MLLTGFNESQNLQAELWLPPVVFHQLHKVLGKRTSKWLGYLDQYLLAPLVLLLHRSVNRKVYYHICDHSNAPFSSVLPTDRTSITCHDVIAIEAASGNRSYGVQPSRLGKIQQKYIRYYLLRLQRIACVSSYTLGRLIGLDPSIDHVEKIEWIVIPNAFNAPFSKVALSNETAERFDIQREKYLFHLGSGHPRKNRSLLPKILKGVRREGIDIKLVLAGEGPKDLEKEAVYDSGMEQHIVWAGRVSHQEAQELYGNSYAFVFPSLSEGFGWPLIEAQACGAPVVCSNRQPMLEVAGCEALFADPSQSASFVEKLKQLKDSVQRQKVVDAGNHNTFRFSPKTIMSQYINFITRTS